MSMLKKLCISATFALFTLTSHAAPVFSDIFVLGDSTVDAGNLNNDAAYANLLGLMPGEILPEPLFFQGRLTDAPNFADLVSLEITGEMTKATSEGGNNFAYGGAVTSGPQIPTIPFAPNMLEQTEQLIAQEGTFSGDELIILSSGFNNFSANDSLPMPLSQGEVLAQVIADLSNIAGQLTALGAQNFLISSVSPAISLFPSDLIPANFFFLDYSAVIQEVAADPLSYGLTGPAISCFVRDGASLLTFGPDGVYDQPGTCLQNGFQTNEFLLLDGIHVTENVQRVLGERALNAIDVSAPASLFLLSFGLFALVARSRKNHS